MYKNGNPLILAAAAFRVAAHRCGREAAIIEALREGGALSLSIGAEWQGHIGGHVAFSPVAIDGLACGWYGLRPLSVEPVRQPPGIGTALVREGQQRLHRAGAGGCVVLGDPAFYRRFGYAGVAPE